MTPEQIHALGPKRAAVRELKKIAVYATIFAALAAYNFSTGIYAWGAPSSCGLLKDDDQRWFCRAQDEGKSSYCASIRDASLRRLCGARTGNPKECASILDRQQRLYCEGISR
jgi:hypothetical protein